MLDCRKFVLLWEKLDYLLTINILVGVTIKQLIYVELYKNNSVNFIGLVLKCD